MRFSTQSELIPERGVVTSYVLEWQTNHFVFLAPPNWQVRCEVEAKQVVLQPKDLSASVTLRILDSYPQRQEPLKVEPLREDLSNRFPEVRILGERPCFASGVAGWAFELERVGANQSKVRGCIAFIPYGAGVVEFHLTAGARKYEDCRRAFGNVITSLRVETGPADKPGAPKRSGPAQQ